MTRKSATCDGRAPVVVITGGSSGIGQCTAALFARRGWHVGLIARGAEGLRQSCQHAEAAGGRVAITQADVTDSIALSNAADTIVAALGPIRVWINCAGNGVYGRFSDVPEAEFQRVTDVTYHGTVNGTRIALAHMRVGGQGRIVNVCSAIAFHGLPLMSSYAGAKAAVRAFGQAVRGELKLERSAIRLSTVFPAAVNTPFFSHATSHMGWPARPAPPVYQPDVIAQGIWRAAVSGTPEMSISGTAAVFSMVSRIAPGLTAWCVARCGIERQITRDPEAGRLQEPNLFAAGRSAAGVYGPFSRHARTYSVHVLLLCWWTMAAEWFSARPLYRRKRPDLPLLPILPPPEPGPAPGGWAIRPDVS